jgi:hypothetical protein
MTGLCHTHGLDLPTLESSGNSEERQLAPVDGTRAGNTINHADETRNKDMLLQAQAEQLVRHYLRHTNSTWSLQHEPTLYHQLESVYSTMTVDTVTRAFDVFVISSE